MTTVMLPVNLVRDSDQLKSLGANMDTACDTPKHRWNTTIRMLEDLPKTGLLRDKQIYPFFGIGRSTWWKWVQEGKAPPGIKLSSRTTVWRAEDIRDLLRKVSQKCD
ncbi:MAG: AlpA family phage regulatory protein [Pseudomonadota bacterium]